MTKISAGFFSSLKDRVRQNRITVINAAVTVALIIIIVVVLLWQAGVTQMRTAEESMLNLAGKTAVEIQAEYNIYFDIARTVSQIMRNYETLSVEQRRSFFNDTMLGVFVYNRSLVNIFTIWKPNVLDGRDSDLADTEGTDSSGQYVSGYTRERGWLEFKSFSEYRYLLEMAEFSRNREFITTPVPSNVWGRDTFTVDIIVPIMSNEELLGVVCLGINMEPLQIQVNHIMPYGTGQLMVFSYSGIIAIHPNLRARGLRYMADDFEQIFTEVDMNYKADIYQSLQSAEPTIFRTNKEMLISYPFSMGASETPWQVVSIVPLAPITAPLRGLINFSVFFILVAGGFAGLVIFFTSSSLARHAQIMQRNLERATVMSDSLKYGLCMLDNNLVIQESYSKALERILSVSELQGKNFITLLSASLKTKEAEGLKDYFEMLFKRSFDEKMLEDINPINEFAYISAETGEAKNLRSSFSLTGWRQDAAYIIVTLEDVTAERELAKQLKEAGDVREKEMNSLFQVIQLNPHILAGFIADAEYEFGRINEILQNRDTSPNEILREIYQSIHSVKSDAAILNLEHFADMLHKLESTIKLKQEKKKIPFDDILGIVFELENIMREKDQLKEAVAKIENFRSHAGQDNRQEAYILNETLQKVCDKAQNELGKKVRLIQDQIDESVLINGPRRIIKEMLTQLVRNAAYHGIENPEERQSAGKYSTGEIRFALWYTEHKAYIKVDDDGRGINFKKVRQRAHELHLIKDPANAGRDFLLQTLFTMGLTTADKANMHAGRGVGLSLVRDRIKELKGTVKLRTEPGKGTSFVICFPLELPAA